MCACLVYYGINRLLIPLSDVTVEIENFLNASFPRYRFVCFFVCGADLVLRCRLYQGAAAFGVIGVARPEYFAKVKEDMAHIAEYERKGKLDEIGRRGIDRYGNFFMVEEETEDVSSTQIRARIANGESVDDLTFPGVTAYLLKQMKAKN
jgi:nicotinic acid mononucleotide adenylyltransferase